VIATVGATRHPEATRNRTWIAAWGVLGIAVTFVEAIARLGHRAWSQLADDGTSGQWLVLAAATAGLTYVEGYRALQRRFAPSVVARSFEVATRGPPLWAVLAPLYAVSLVGAPPRVITRSALGVAAIVACVLVVRGLPAPARGIIDGAVAIALGWGLVALLACFVQALVRRARARSPATRRDPEAH
jgi:hypothetical protein